MRKKHIHKKTPFARWLINVRTKAKLTQAEAVERMKHLGKGVSVETWSRWESSVRLPPRTKIDAVADTLGVKREVARRRAGYNVLLKPRRKQHTNVIAAMLRELSGNLATENKILKLYVLASAYLNKTDPRFDLEEMQRITRLFDDLKELSYEQRAEAWEKIRQIFAEAKELPVMTIPVEQATMIFPEQNWPAVMLGTKVSIEYRDSKGGEMWQSYVVKALEKKEDKLVAIIVATAS